MSEPRLGYFRDIGSERGRRTEDERERAREREEEYMMSEMVRACVHACAYSSRVSSIYFEKRLEFLAFARGQCKTDGERERERERGEDRGGAGEEIRKRERERERERGTSSAMDGRTDGRTGRYHTCALVDLDCPMVNARMTACSCVLLDRAA